MNGPDGYSEFAGVIGDPVRHSLSPTIHNAAYREMGLNWYYGAFAVAVGDVPAAINGARALGFRGLSVTMPHKFEAARAAEQLSHRAEVLGSANTITFRAGVAIAESLDGEGLIADLDGAGFSPRGEVCAVIGAGGAARSVILAFADAGAKSILVVNRTPKNAADAVTLAPQVAQVATVNDLAEASIVVNATPVGMGTSPSGLSPELGDFVNIVCSSQLVVDLIYWPFETEFLRACADRGASTRNGLGMLVSQAARQIELWSGMAAPVPTMTKAVREHLSSRAQ